MSLYIHHSSCISPQHTFGEPILDELIWYKNGISAIEPKYPAIPPRELRRMGKVVRMGLGTALDILEQTDTKPNGIIIGTGNGGMEHCVLFLKQITDYNEGVLTPGNFVQSTSNAIASSIGLATQNFGYNNTHVHEGLAFEMALIDAQLQLTSFPGRHYLVGGLDDMATYNNNIDNLAGWNRIPSGSTAELYSHKEIGTIPGEGAAMFLVSDEKEGATSKIVKIKTWYSDDPIDHTNQIENFKSYCDSKDIYPDVIISGKNGDVREDLFYQNFESQFEDRSPVYYKQMCGDYPTAGSFGLWLANYIMHVQKIPESITADSSPRRINSVLLYNSYHKFQHSLILLTKA